MRNISKRYDDNEVMRNINLDIADGEFVVFVGPSGCGKSTLMRMIAGLEDISSGDLSIDAMRMNDVPPAKRGIAMVFQSYALYPHMTLYDNMAFGLKLAGAKKPEIDQAVRNAAKILHIDHLLERKPKQLSGGQRQRVAIGRAITRKPKVFLFDEPLSNLDAALRVQMRLELIKLHKQLNATMIYVTHDQTEAMTMADRIVVLNHGAVEQIGSPLELYRNPRNRFVAGFIGSPKMNFIDVQVSAADGAGVTIALPGGAALSVPRASDGVRAGDTLTLGVRPEHLMENGADGCDARFAGEVIVVEHLGGETLSHVGLAGGGTIQVKGSGESAAADGQRIEVGFSVRHAHLFRQDGLALGALREAAQASAAPAEN
ncbi:MAG TPA: sn-glycerol-3-phosphate ABC transporter ATP-binding protein UgpC [Trinickia sp.]|uniref:ABC transporter ATP-binding protein n=1 Tax=Trinickia sp. TaxID=2571163 RepID=UPI002C4521A2|nr:sn-glycerol-3-phosphate ABC transporter ATP-binding protein UgpC [Trinickia sp.]HTI18098.1 sn-glycerol-3-phosphate ABC transporter ATP-binding protein UgpC [Trinickia sp.]